MWKEKIDNLDWISRIGNFLGVVKNQKSLWEPESMN